MAGPTAGVVNCKYLFTLVKTKDSQSVLKICQGNNIFKRDLFLIIYINYHGTAR